MKKILLFIRSLNAGGAERQLVVTAKSLAERGHVVTVLTFYSDGFYDDELSGTKVRLLSLHKKGRWDLLAFFYKLIILLRKLEPDVVYSFLGTANIFSVLTRCFIPRTRIIWGVRASNVNLSHYDRVTRWNYWVECRLARFADNIVVNSHAGLEYAVAHGFPREKMTVISNGIDTEHFRQDKEAGDSVRKMWGVGEDKYLIGLVGRIEPIKGYPTFLEAAALIKRQRPNVRFVCVGKGEIEYENAMHMRAIELEIDDALIWAGRQSNMMAVYNALDIFCSSSCSEGFPNVIGEAMSCGVPCVVTDVGDSALIVGEVGKVVPPNDAKLLADAVLLELTLNNKGIMQRNRIVSQYSLARLCEKTEEIVCL